MALPKFGQAWLPITVLALPLGLAGCGEDGSSAASPVPAGTATPAPTPTPTPTPVPTGFNGAATAAATTVDLNNLLNYANPVLPAYYDATVSALDNTPAANPVNDRLATLGRVLFYDRQLSINNAVSCASCHQQGAGFDDPARFSTGFAGNAFTSAHAMRLGNARYWQPGSMFWDRRAASLEAQASQPIINPVEMGWDANAGGIAALTTKLQRIDYYNELFLFAFGDATITEARMQAALANFQRAMISTGSRFNTGYAQVFSVTAPNRGLGIDFPNFTAQENRGKTLFVTGRAGGGAGCAACHVAPTFALNANSRSNGLDAGETTVFKSPSLMSVGLSRNFMHDGRFSTLAQVVQFYDSGVQAGPALDNRLRNPDGTPIRLGLSQADRDALVAFMLTLNDSFLTADLRFSSPFR